MSHGEIERLQDWMAKALRSARAAEAATALE
jgi:hypothetical protein